MQTIGFIIALLIGWLGVRLIAKSEKNRKKYKHWDGIYGSERKQDDYYIGYVIQFFVGLLMIFGCIVTIGLLQAN